MSGDLGTFDKMISLFTKIKQGSKSNTQQTNGANLFNSFMGGGGASSFNNNNTSKPSNDPYPKKNSKMRGPTTNLSQMEELTRMYNDKKQN